MEGIFLMVENDAPARPGRRTAVRVLVPVAVAAVAAAGIGLVPALAEDQAPKLPSITAEQLVAKTLSSNVRTMSGTLQVNADLGVPPALLSAAAQAAGPSAGPSAGASPQAKLTELLSGRHDVQIAVDGPDKQRVQLADYQLVHNGDQAWAWDGGSKQAVHLTHAPKQGQQDKQDKQANPDSMLPVTPQDAAKRLLTESASTTDISLDGTGRVAGRSVYQLMVKPKQSGSTLRDVRISVDSETGVPLAVLVQAADGSRVLDAHFSSVSFAEPDAKTFEFSLPAGGKLTEAPQHKPGIEATHPGAKPESGPESGPAGKKSDFNVTGEGWTTVFASKPQGASAGHSGHADAKGGLGALGVGKQVKGGSLISTKVVNVLLTDDGRIYAGAVTLPVLQQAAGIK
jgi:outer membrane lipoprotein-sorting protein